MLIHWVKKNGNSIATNDEDTTIDYALSLGWKRTDEEGNLIEEESPAVPDVEEADVAPPPRKAGKVTKEKK